MPFIVEGGFKSRPYLWCFEQFGQEFNWWWSSTEDSFEANDGVWYGFSAVYRFKHERDAILFKLRWI